MLGNGDLYGIVWEKDGELFMRITKNDIWDARIDTSRDPQMLKVDVANQKWSGGGGNVPSWGNAYPSPRSAAIVKIGTGKSTAWRCIRAEGTAREWRQHDGIGVMAIEGKAGESAGYRWDLDSTVAKP